MMIFYRYKRLLVVNIYHFFGYHVLFCRVRRLMLRSVWFLIVRNGGQTGLW